jgi:hypothetical protein
MKTTRDTSEFERFTQALRKVLSVSKHEIQRRMEMEKRKPKAPAPRDSGASKAH